MAKFKVGDRVRISLLTDNHSNAWLELNNETGKVTTVVEGFEVTSYRVQLDKPLVIDREDYTFTQKNAIINENELLPIEDKDSVKILKVGWEIGNNCIYVDHDGSRHKAMIVDLEYRDEIEEIWYTVEYEDNNGNLVRFGTIEDALYNLPEFKVGDRVTVLHEDYEGQEGIVGRVMENEDNPRYIVNIRYPEKVIMVCFGKDDLELSSNQDKSAAGPYIDYTEPKFKQDDLVEFYSDEAGSNIRGKIIQIKMPTSNMKTIRYVVYTGDIGLPVKPYFEVNEDDLELVDLAPKKVTKFTHGDYVYIANSERYNYYYANAVGMIDSANTSGATEPSYKVYFNHEVLDHASPFFAESDLALIPRYPKYKVHDLVRLLNPDVGGSIKVISYYADADKFSYNVCHIDVENGTAKTYLRSEDELKPDFIVEYFHLFVSQPMSGLDMEDILKARQSAIDDFKILHKEFCRFKQLVVIDNIQEEFTKQCEQEGRTPHSLEYLGNDIKMMKDADAIVFAKGWENSKGCSVEFLVAKNNNIPMYFE